MLEKIKYNLSVKLFSRQMRIKCIAVLTAGDGYSGTQDGSGEVLEGGADSGDDICQYNAGTGHTDGDTGLGHNTCADDLTIGDTHQRPEPNVSDQLGFLSFS